MLCIATAGFALYVKLIHDVCLLRDIRWQADKPERTPQVVSALSAEYEACEHSDYVRIPDSQLALFRSFCDLSCCFL